MKRTLCNFNQYGLLALILLAFSAGPLMAQSPTVVKTDVGTTSEKQVTEKSVFQTENSVAKVIDEQRSNVIVNDDADVVLNSEKVRVSSRTIPSSSNLDGLTPANVNPDESSFPAPMKKSQQVTNPDKWEFGFAPYLFTAGLKGTIGARGRTADIDLSFGDIFKKLKLGIMGTLDARKGKFVIVNDMMWIKLAKETETPLALYSSAKLGSNIFIWDPEVGYRVHSSKAGSFDVLGGIRLMSVETNLNFRAGILPAFDVSQRKTWATPVVGARGILNLSPKLYLSTKFDIGGGLGADFTGQFYGGAGYRITPKIALVGGYRYLNTNYDDKSGFLFDANMSGLLFGAKFQF